VNYLVDTNVISEVTRPRPHRGVLRWLAKSDEDRVYLSVISLAELHRGIALLDAGRRRTTLEEWVRSEIPQRFGDRLLNVDGAIAARWGDIMAAAKRAGIAVSVIDGFLAATARARDLAIVSRNRRDFAPLGLSVINPWDD
jgi:predicted nucleic acid-binding protein